MTSAYKTLATKLIHAGEPHPKVGGAVSLPVFQSSTFEYDDEAGQENLKYIRLSNTPNHEVLHHKLAALENAEAALVTASGMAAISMALMSVLSAGDHLLIQEGLYGGTHKLLINEFAPLDLTFDFVDPQDPQDWAAKLRRETKALYVETIGNPLMQIPNLPAAVDFARGHGLVSLVDNTFASPVNFRPAEHGFDLSLHSGTKYLNGHSDIVAGAVIGRSEFVEAVARKVVRFGGSLDPHACFLLHRGLKTLAVRVDLQNRSALKIARWLENHPRVERVNYPGLNGHPQHRRARELLDGYGGMLSFELSGGVEAARNLMKNLSIPVSAPSLGGVETLITRPVTTSHRGLPEKDLDRMGITGGLIRMSIGLEDADELIADLDRGLSIGGAQ